MHKSDDILPYIPQRPPFVMVDTLSACSEMEASTQFTVTLNNIFISNNQLTEPALIENIAQTAAAHMGYTCAQQQKAVPVGFIGAVQNLKIFHLPQIGDVLNTTITIKNQIFNATIIEGKISANEKEIAVCEMKIFVQ